MAGSVIVRHGHTIIDQCIHYDDRPLAWAEADKRAGFRLDRRRAWAFVNGELCQSIRWTDTCSGCSCDCGDGYPCSHGAGGCEECGYQGKVRNAMWMPARIANGTPCRRT